MTATDDLAVRLYALAYGCAVDTLDDHDIAHVRRVFLPLIGAAQAQAWDEGNAAQEGDLVETGKLNQTRNPYGEQA